MDSIHIFEYQKEQLAQIIKEVNETKGFLALVTFPDVIGYLIEQYQAKENNVTATT